MFCAKCGGRWVDNMKVVKYSPKSKRGKPVGSREVVEKFKSLGTIALERAFNGGNPPPSHGQVTWQSVKVCKPVNGKHFAIHVRVNGYAHNRPFPSPLGDHKSTLRRRAAKAAVRDEVLDLEDCE